MFKIYPNYCAECVAHFEKRAQDVPCETGVCVVTKRDPEDEEAPMFLSEPEMYVALSYLELTDISERSRYTKIIGEGRKQQEVTSYLPTLSNLAAWLSANDWNSAPLEPAVFIKAVGVFHQSYLGMIK